MKWQVNLIGDSEELERLSKIFREQNLSLTREGGGYSLESQLFEASTDVEAVKTIADKLLTALNATKTLAFNSSIPIRRGAIRSQDLQGNQSLFLENNLSVILREEVRITAINKNGTSIEIPPHNTMKNWIPLMYCDERVQRVFNLINHDFTSFGGFYKIIEVVQEDNFPPVLRDGEFYNEINRFKQTAQSYEAIGEEARHAHTRFTRPEIPMDLSRARDLIQRIVKMWLDSKI